MKTKQIEKSFIGKKIFHIADGNEIILTNKCENQTVATMYIENNVLNIVTKDAQYLYEYFNHKNIESWGNYERTNKKWKGVLQNH